MKLSDLSNQLVLILVVRSQLLLLRVSMMLER